MQPPARTKNKIAAWRTYRGYTQAELSRRLGVSASTLRAWETDVYMPDSARLTQLCSMLKCSPRDLYPRT